jgi:Bacterial Ig domain
MRSKSSLGFLLSLALAVASACSSSNPTAPTRPPEAAASAAAPASGNQKPTVSFTAPIAGATLTGVPDSHTCAVAVSDSDGSIESVEFTLVGGETKTNFQGTKSESSYLCSFDTKNYPNGEYTLTVRVIDNQGANAEASVSVRIENKVTTTPAPNPGSPACALSRVDYLVEEFKVLTTPEHGLHRYARIRNLGCEMSYFLGNYVAKIGTSLDPHNQILFSSDPAVGQPKRFLKTGEVGEFRAGLPKCGESQSDLVFELEVTATPNFGPNGEYLLKLPAGGNHFGNSGICTPPVCTTTLSLAATYANGAISILPTAPGSARPVTLSVSVDGGAATTLPPAQTGTAASFAIPQDGTEHTAVIKGKFFDTNGALCESQTSVVVPRRPVCTALLSLSARFANGTLSILATAPGIVRTVALSISVDGGAATALPSAQTGTTANFALALDDKEHTVTVRGTFADTNGAPCEGETSITVLPISVCTAALTLTGGYANGLISILPTAPGAVRTVTLSVSVDGGAATTPPPAQTGTASTIPLPQDDKEHTVVVKGKFTDTNGALCEGETSVKVPKKEPTCTEVAAKLQHATPPVSTLTEVLLNVSPSWQGSYTATLQLCNGQVITPVSGTTYPFSVPRGPTQSTCTMTLLVDEGKLNCKAQLPVVIDTCDVVNHLSFKVDSSSATVVNGAVTVAVSATASNAPGRRVGILWENGGLTRIKESRPLDVACVAGTKNVAFSFGPSGLEAHLPANGAKYFVIFYTGPDEAPVIQKDSLGNDHKYAISVN